MQEQELIKRYFHVDKKQQENVKLSIGDDAAVVSYQDDIVISCDTLVQGTHFDANTDPYYLGRKALAVNLSDIAAMGSTPLHALLSLTLPSLDENWLDKFSKGFFSQADTFNIALIGGDIVRGSSISISITILGKAGDAVITRSGALVDHDVWLSGTVGGAGFELLNGIKASDRSYLHNPEPQIELGLALPKFASSAIDLSDGLAIGAIELANMSNCSICLEASKIPLAKHYKVNSQDTIEKALSSGEDYELLFTADKSFHEQITQFAKDKKIPLAVIGKVTREKISKINFGDKNKSLQQCIENTFQHFKVNKDLVTNWASNVQLAQELAKLAVETKASISVAESCTGGLVAAVLTSIPGSSQWFNGSITSYVNEIKSSVLGVDKQILAKNGPVDEQVAQQMCQGVKKLFDTTHAVAITGWAGPTVDDNNQLGKVCINWIANSKEMAKTYMFTGDRDSVRHQACAKVIDELFILLKTR